MSPEEINIALQYMYEQDTTIIENQLRKGHSNEFIEFYIQVMHNQNDYSKPFKIKPLPIQERILIATLVELHELTGFTKSNCSFDSSIYVKLTEYFDVKPETMQDYYYKNRKEAENLAAMYRQWINNPDQFTAEMGLNLRGIIQLSEYLSIIK